MRYWTGGLGDISEHAAGLDPEPVPSDVDVEAMLADLGPVAPPTDAELDAMARWYGEPAAPVTWGRAAPGPCECIPF